MRNPTVDEMFGETHPFVGTGDQCKYIVNDYVGECGCVRLNPIHDEEDKTR